MKKELVLLALVAVAVLYFSQKKPAPVTRAVNTTAGYFPPNAAPEGLPIYAPEVDYLPKGYTV